MAETTATKKSSGHLAGQIQKNGVAQGTYQVNLRGFTSAKWSKTNADVKDTLSMEAGCVGFADGTKAIFRIFERNSNCPDVQIDKVESQVSGDKISAQWKYPRDRWSKAKPSKRPILPRYRFECNCHGWSLPMHSGLLQLSTTITITVLDDAGQAVANAPFELFLSTRQILSASTDGSGKAKFEKIPLGCHRIKFQNNPLIAPDKPTKIESPLECQKFALDLFDDNAFYANSVVVRCNHKVDDNYRFVINPPYYAVVQDSPKEKLAGKPKEADAIHVYADKKKSLNEKGGEKVEQETETGFSKSVMECNFKGKTDYNMILNPHFWSDYNKPTEYEIQGLKKNLPIKAYSPDEFKLSIKFPPPKKFDVGKKYKGEESIVYDLQTKQLNHQTFRFEEEKKEGQWGKLEHPLAIGSTDRPLSLEVNGKAIEIKALDAFASVLLLSKKLGEIIDLVTKSMPKAGYYTQLHYEILSGKLALGWQWKEYSDHRVFCGMAASVEMKLIEVAWELGVGISAFLCEGQVFCQINGEVTIGFEGERVSPDDALELKIPFGAKLEGVVGARVKATFMFHVELTGSTAIEVGDGAFKISTNEGLSTSANLRWTGFKGKVKVSAGPAKAKGNKEFTGEQATAISHEGENVWIREVDLGEFEWPSKGEYQQHYLTTEEIRKVFMTVFSKHENLVVESQAPNKSMLLNDVINEIVSHFDEVPRLDRSNRVMEAIAFGIKDKLVSFSSESDEKDVDTHVISYDTFAQFCREGELKTILINAEDQTEDLKEKLRD